MPPWGSGNIALLGRPCRVWTSSLQGIVHEPQTWWWNPRAAIGSGEDAFRFADYFVQQIRHGRRTGEDFWVLAAQDPLPRVGVGLSLRG